MGIKNPAKTILAAVEGKTEKIYLNKVKHSLKLASVKIKFIEKSDPVKLVEKIRKQIEDYDEIWCIFDREFDQSRIEKFRKAIKKGRKYNLAVSNPKIEYWFLLHFEKTAKRFSNNKQIDRAIKKHCSNFKKKQNNLSLFCSHISQEPFLEEACKNSKWVLEKHHKCGKNPSDIAQNLPSTNMHILVSEFLSILENRKQ
jgi:hypothetical protein